MTVDTEDADLATEPTRTGLLELRSLADLGATAFRELWAVPSRHRNAP